MAYTFAPIDDRTQWESFVLEHSSAALFQSWSWGEVEQQLEHTIWRYGMYDNGRLIGLSQIMKVIARRATFLHVRHGPVFDYNDTGTLREKFQSFFEFMRDLGKREGAWFVRVSPLIEDSEENRGRMRAAGLHAAPIHAMDAELCWVLDLAKSEEELISDMRKSTRYEIRRAKQLGVDVITTRDTARIGEFTTLYKATSQRQGFTQHRGIEEEFEIFVRTKQALLFLARYESKPIAGAIILFYGGQAIYHHGASLSTKIPSSHLIQWEAICEAKRRGIMVYNFWGIAPEDKPNHPWRGITLFKKGFGGREIQYLHAHDLHLSPFYVIPRTIESARRIIKGY